MRRYATVAAGLGLAATWGSENAFWSAPRDETTAVALLMTWIAYSLCVAAALSGVLWSGVQGWRAVFLGGALLGWLIEGVVVATMYDAFPFQVVWTPLAWHALVTGLGVVGVGRMAGTWPLRRTLAAWTGLGLWLGLTALYWPLERTDLPSGWAALGPVGGYLVGLGLVVPLANVVLDRIGTLDRPRPRVLAAAPALLALAWSARVLLAPTPLYAALPVVLLLTLWMMRRLGSPGEPLSLGTPAPLWRHLLFLVAPAIATVVAAVGWSLTDGAGTNVVFAIVGGVASLGLFGSLARQAIRRRRS